MCKGKYWDTPSCVLGPCFGGIITVRTQTNKNHTTNNSNIEAFKKFSNQPLANKKTEFWGPVAHSSCHSKARKRGMKGHYPLLGPHIPGKWFRSLLYLLAKRELSQDGNPCYKKTQPTQLSCTGAEQLPWGQGRGATCSSPPASSHRMDSLPWQLTWLSSIHTTP